MSSLPAIIKKQNPWSSYVVKRWSVHYVAILPLQTLHICLLPPWTYVQRPHPSIVCVFQAAAACRVTRPAAGWGSHVCLQPVQPHHPILRPAPSRRDMGAGRECGGGHVWGGLHGHPQADRSVHAFIQIALRCWSRARQRLRSIKSPLVVIGYAAAAGANLPHVHHLVIVVVVRRLTKQCNPLGHQVDPMLLLPNTIFCYYLK